ncbi:hypothetical protein ASPSYDRAFT_94593 [Aspergillus sydowii CBS 593.65]|uniref:Uncharacterized protein n=1 Tax=Aspergillus sydowii CBS 593.65 TaxID=1036612 RepID=A0A1L9T1S4_9EURO|nr:uncharacterized protein ASPSYDRAFT_94593 [Aspergillus sydowii CBS 593.65]OJJ53386.1 hypothetical protein ASPSYDRAFT_94593 [Aspergillus sydowii CBS 593.65]
MSSGAQKPRTHWMALIGCQVSWSGVPTLGGASANGSPGEQRAAGHKLRNVLAAAVRLDAAGTARQVRSSGRSETDSGPPWLLPAAVEPMSAVAAITFCALEMDPVGRHLACNIWWSWPAPLG